MYTPPGLRLNHRGLVKGEGPSGSPPSPWSSVLLTSSPVSSTSTSPAHTGGGSSSNSSVVLGGPPTSSNIKSPNPSAKAALHARRRILRRRRRLLNDSTTSLIGAEEESDEETTPGERGVEGDRASNGLVMSHESPELSMVLEKAVVLLTPDEFASLRLTISEYEDGTLSVEEFARDLLDLLADEEKSSFFTELRELVRLPDLSIWDRLIYSKYSLHDGRNRMVGPGKKLIYHPWERPRFLFKPESSLNQGGESFRSHKESSSPSHRDPSLLCSRANPYEDEDTPFLPRGESIYRNPPCRSFHSSGFLQHARRNNGPRQNGSSPKVSYSLQESLYGRRGRESGDPHSPLHHSHGRNFPFDVLDMENCRLEFLRPPTGSLAKREQHGRSPNMDDDNQATIRINKNWPTLGIAIEGGINTQQSLPRIIAIQPNGAAYRTGGIKVGQLIKEVNGICLSGLPHETVARIIAECYAKRDEPCLTLLVKNQKLTPAEQRRSLSIHH